MDISLAQVIADYIRQRKEAKLEPLKKALNKVLDKDQNEVAQSVARAEYSEKSAPIEAQFKPIVWLGDAARRAKQISLATHCAKFTHSDAKASSMLMMDSCSDIQTYLSTAKLKDKAIDAVGNAAALDVAKLLKLTVNGESLVSQLQAGRQTVLAEFTDDAELLAQWQQGFRLALSDERLSSHSLSKQLYFPVEDDYHLLCPLYSSALAHRLYQEISKARFGDSKDIRDARRNGLYAEQQDVSFSNTLVSIAGGSKPQNISQLNSERYGQTFLLNSAPPRYEYKRKPPTNRTSMFDRQFSFKAFESIKKFKDFLENLKDSDKNFKTRYQRDFNYVQPIIDMLLNEAMNVQSMEGDAGWSNDESCRLRHIYSLWLDINNPDEKFQSERAKLNWIDEVAQDFANWMKQQLKSKEYKLGDAEHGYFKKLCLIRLKEFERNTPVFKEQSV